MLSGLIIGVDPGKSGGIAFIRPPEGACAINMPDTIKDIWEEFNYLTGAINRVRKELNEDRCFAYLEKVWSQPGDGGRQAFAFGQNYGYIEMALTAAEIPYEYITPTKWQKEFGLTRTNKSETKTQKKNRHKAAAQRLFPQVKVTHAISDALLIAEYGRRQRITP